METLTTILSWYNDQAAPNKQRRYHACPICGTTWWGNSSGLFSHEIHKTDCWVPLLQQAAPNIASTGLAPQAGTSEGTTEGASR